MTTLDTLIGTLIITGAPYLLWVMVISADARRRAGK